MVSLEDVTSAAATAQVRVLTPEPVISHHGMMTSHTRNRLMKEKKDRREGG